MPKSKPRLERARAALRLAQDGTEPVPVRDLTQLAGASPEALVRWITQGRGGLYLDGLKDGSKGWVSTPQAVRRFLRAVADRAGHQT